MARITKPWEISATAIIFSYVCIKIFISEFDTFNQVNQDIIRIPWMDRIIVCGQVSEEVSLHKY